VIIQDLRQPPIGTVIDPDEVYRLAYTGKSGGSFNRTLQFIPDISKTLHPIGAAR
jgi:hypothetical protein